MLGTQGGALGGVQTFKVARGHSVSADVASRLVTRECLKPGVTNLCVVKRPHPSTHHVMRVAKSFRNRRAVALSRVSHRARTGPDAKRAIIDDRGIGAVVVDARIH